ncbi:transcriptional regulator, MarR family [Catenulispora acidiphila DSM 44928]|uniref:Transcriptional regulator, MarR family n=1 Tax=Catenulispora acidiphila (strain DSM 44928 / JCM 14897 / NBRC 102108 / NRRL B-24433 / ID139908) TaxID=479433 RepID=C7QDF2_CATAD|nr:MarR family transcriptional regulator [Catenulispora acidiphila]ACU72745.1 transcriptional regulator, MarR family [Catenulispora acidiphila DSM 44928]
MPLSTDLPAADGPGADVPAGGLLGAAAIAAATDSVGLQDSVDRFLEGWAQVQPDLDLSPVAVVQRLGRVRRIIEAEVEATFAEFGLNGPDYIALATLRQLDQPEGVPQRRLMRELGLTSGTISVRIERLADRSLVAVAPDPADRRNTLVSLAPAGRDLLDRVTPAHLSTESRLLAALDSEQRETLSALLRLLLVAFEGSVSTGALPRLGLSLTPAHRAIEIRRAVGLPEIAGLLVKAVDRDSRADRADIRTGDVLINAGGRELRSVASLHAALRGAAEAEADTLTVDLIRGVDAPHQAVLDLSPHCADQKSLPAAFAHDTVIHQV